MYSGLKFYYTFETEDFIFIPVEIINEEEKKSVDIVEIFSCRYEKNSKFYVLLKEAQDSEYKLEKFSEESFFKFKLLESFFTLVFSNYVKREGIFIIEKINSDYTVQKLFNKITRALTEENLWKERSGIESLLWDGTIIIYYLQELIDKIFNTLSSILNKEDFAMRYAFSIDMYLRGKFGENEMRYLSDLWVSLEVLASITISHIIHNHDYFKTKNKKVEIEGEMINFFKELKDVVKTFSSRLNLEDIDCWPKMKNIGVENKFAEHMSNKINKHLPIFQKCVKVAEEYLSIDDVKVNLRKEEDYDDPTKYQEYLTAVKDFKEYQDNMTIKRILDFFSTNRNRLFHGGVVDAKWSLEFDRYKASFVKILEQLFFRVLGLTTLQFYQMGYPYQKIFPIPNEDGTEFDLSKISRTTWNYVDDHHIVPFLDDFADPYDRSAKTRAIEKIIDKYQYLESLRNKLNSSSEIVAEFLNKSHSGKVIFKESTFNNEIIFDNFDDGRIRLKFGSDSGVYGVIYNKNPVKVTNLNDDIISSTFMGRMDDDNVRGLGPLVPFITNPPYICFVFK